MRRNAKTRAATFVFCWLLSMTWWLGCSNSNAPQPGSESIGATQVEGLTGAPITVTLATPNPVSPLAPVLQASNSIFLGPGANIVSGMVVAMSASGGTLHAEPDAVLNETWSRGTVELRDRDQVRGILHTKFPPPADAGLTPGGTDTTPHFDPASTLTWNVVYPSTTPGPDVNAWQGLSLSADPGQYGTLNASSQGTITLRSGTYYVNNLTVESAGLIRLDQAAGPVIIYVTGSIAFRGAIVAVGGAFPDLLIGYLGTADIVIDSLFNGAFIAPFAKLTLRPVTGIHTGFFAAKDYSTVDAHVQVQYSAPLAIAVAAKPSGPACRQIVAGLVPPSSLSQALARYCGGGNCFDDTDRDGVPDCLDACPFDPNKTDPATCGCGRPETDSDGDGTPDCVDKCPSDPNNTALGQCGCVGRPGLKPAGTPCDDTPCPQSGATCNGAGVCGNRSACSPGTNCKLIESEAVFYYICGERPPTGGSTAPDAGISDAGSSPPPGQLTQTAAQAACSAKGEMLTRIDTLSQNQFISRFLSTPLWLGANDITTSGTWRWSDPNSVNGDTFWSGGPTGTRVNNRFSNWGAGAPGSQRCAMIRRDGQWFDADCSEPAGYICEFRLLSSRPADAGLGPGFRPPGMTAPPPLRGDGSAGAQRVCIPEADAGLPTDAAVLQAQIALAAQDVFVGAAASPPAVGSTCPDNPDANNVGLRPDAGEGCALTNIALGADGSRFECLQQSDCTQFGTGFLCRQVKDDPTCIPVDAGGPIDGGPCRGHSYCGKISCPANPFPNRCNQIEVCGPYPDTDAGPDPTSNLDAETFDPAKLFDAGVPSGMGSPGYSDDPVRGDAGKNHSWCFMKPQNDNALPPATQAARNKKGTSGASSIITFGFDPDLVFDVKTPQLAMGVPDLNLHAAGKFIAKVSLNNFLGQSYSANIIDVVAGVTAKLCEINDTETHFQVLGLDFVDPGDLPLFDTKSGVGVSADVAKASKTCSDAVDTFTVWANRAKKAFRDAHQLVSQYKSITSVKGLLSGDLCKQIGVIGSDVPGFPGGNICYPNEPVELTINRFLDYFQAPGTGQLTQFRRAAGSAMNAIHSVADALNQNVKHDFDDLNREESHTITTVPFAIGPVPMLLQIDAFAEYGIAGGFGLTFDFQSIFGLDADPDVDPSAPTQANPKPPHTVASLNARVVPHASAGLAAFVAAGFSLGPFSAAVGLEGAVSLAEVEAPVYAGVGLGVLVTKDVRPLPPDIGAVVGPEAAAFRIPKAFKFFVTYDYGAAVELSNVMSGEINAKLRISFAFFSRTWRKRVVKFSGWSFHFDLISGSSGPDDQTPPKRPVIESDKAPTNVVSGNTTLGMAETQVPLMNLPYLQVPDTSDFDGGVYSFDASRVQGLFYDDLCCSKQNEACSFTKTPRCCPGFTCFATDGTSGTGFCSPTCRVRDEACSTTNDCCTADAGAAMVCGSMKTCVRCQQTHATCATSADCCAGLNCGADGTCAPPCKNPGESCTTDTDCCGRIGPDGGINDAIRCDPTKKNICTTGIP